ERLAASGEQEDVQRQHLVYCCTLAERYEVGYQSSDRLFWLDQMEVELPNVRAALSRAQDRASTVEGLRLYGALGLFWRVHGHHREGEAWGRRLLGAAATAPAPPGVQAKAFFTAANIAYHLHGSAAANPLFAESVRLFRMAGDEPSLGWALTYLAATEHVL